MAAAIGLLVGGGSFAYSVATRGLNGVLVVLAWETATPVVPTVTPSPTPSPTRTATPTAPPTDTPTAEPTLPYAARRATAEPDLAEARRLMEQERYADALAAWDRVLAVLPDDPEPHAVRADAYRGLARGESSLGVYLLELARAVDDLDQAIALAPTVGDYYLSRHDVFVALGNSLPYRADRDTVLGLAQENLDKATELGSPEPFAGRSRPFLLILMGRCQEGIDEIERLLPSASLVSRVGLNVGLAHGYLCLGQSAKALAAAERSLTSYPLEDAQFTRAVALVDLGRLSQARDVLDESIANSPYGCGCRYYLRALIHYDLGHPDLALADLAAGETQTWDRGGPRAYVLGRMAIEAGDRAEGIALILEAQATLTRGHVRLRERMLADLAALGAEAVAPTPSVAADATALPTAAANAESPTAQPAPVTRPAPTQPAPSPATGGHPPSVPNAVVASLDLGTGPLDLPPGAYPVFRFALAAPLGRPALQAMTFHLVSAQAAGTPTLQLYVWDWSGGWAMNELQWGANDVRLNGNFLGPGGEIYAALRNWRDQPVTADNAGFTLRVRLADGSTATVGLGR